MKHGRLKFVLKVGIFSALFVGAIFTTGAAAATTCSFYDQPVVMVVVVNTSGMHSNPGVLMTAFENDNAVESAQEEAVESATEEASEAAQQEAVESAIDEENEAVQGTELQTQVQDAIDSAASAAASRSGTGTGSTIKGTESNAQVSGDPKSTSVKEGTSPATASEAKGSEAAMDKATSATPQKSEKAEMGAAAPGVSSATTGQGINFDEALAFDRLQLGEPLVQEPARGNQEVTVAKK